MAVASADALAKRMRAVGEATQKAQRIAVTKAAAVMKETHVTGLRADAPSMRLRNVGKKGAKLGVRYKVKGGASDPSATVEATGPWQILNNPAKAHEIRGRKGKVIHFGSLFRASVKHPGHRGKQTWQKAQPAAAKAGTAELNKTTTRAVQQAFKG